MNDEFIDRTDAYIACLMAGAVVVYIPFMMVVLYDQFAELELRPEFLAFTLAVILFIFVVLPAVGYSALKLYFEVLADG